MIKYHKRGGLWITPFQFTTHTDHTLSSSALHKKRMNGMASV